MLIPLTKGYEATVDPEDFELFGHLKWTALEYRGGIVYAHRKVQDSSGKSKNLYLHRAILGAADGILVDHIDGNGLNCRRNNLRQATYSQNRYNSKPLPNATGFIGVRSLPNGFMGRVMAAGKTFTTQTFLHPEDAAAARDILARQIHGEFAVLNFNAV